MKIEIGKYYLRKNYDGVEELVYIFGEESAEEAEVMTYPEEVNKDEVINMIGIKVLPFIAKDSFLQFKQSMYTETVYKATGKTVYPVDWVETFPSSYIIERFEKSSYFMGLIKKFIKHMDKEFAYKYKKEEVRAKEVLL